MDTLLSSTRDVRTLCAPGNLVFWFKTARVCASISDAITCRRISVSPESRYQALRPSNFYIVSETVGGGIVAGRSNSTPKNLSPVAARARSEIFRPNLEYPGGFFIWETPLGEGVQQGLPAPLRIMSGFAPFWKAAWGWESFFSRG